MIAFHNNASIKEKYIKRLKEHYKEDEFIKGKYWESGKGCAVGCTIHDSDHKKYETELGIPVWLAQVEDVIFEGLPNITAKEWPIKFLESINPGCDLEKIRIPFLIFIIESTLDKFNHEKFPMVKESTDKVLCLLKRINNNFYDDNYAATRSATDAYAAAVAASAAAYAAASAAAYAAASAAAYAAADAAAAAYAAASASAYAAAYAAADAAADAAAYAAADADASAYAAAYAAAVARSSAAAYSAAYAADAAASAAAYAAADAAAAASGAAADYSAVTDREKSYENFSNKLIELIISL